MIFNRGKRKAKVVADRLLGIKPFDASTIEKGDHLVLGDLRFRCHATTPYGSRCSNCHAKDPEGKFAWVSDGTNMGEPLPALIATEKANRYNGHASAWCVPCVLRLIEKAGGQAPVVEKKPIIPKPQPPTAQEIEMVEKRHKAFMEQESRKHELAHALTNRVLTADEIREVAGHGINLYIQMRFSGGCGMSSESYSEEKLQQRLSTAWQIQTNLRMAEGK